LVRYQNRTKYDIPDVDFYNPDAKINCFDYAIFSSKRKYEQFLNSDTVGGVDILWGSEMFKKDEQKREEREQSEEWDEIDNEFLNDDDEVLGPSRKER